jgi:hypothetical protein
MSSETSMASTPVLPIYAFGREVAVYINIRPMAPRLAPEVLVQQKGPQAAN